MPIRLHGTDHECRRAADYLARHFDVLDISWPYPDRPPSQLVRIYLTARVPAEKEKSA